MRTTVWSLLFVAGLFIAGIGASVYWVPAYGQVPVGQGSPGYRPPVSSSMIALSADGPEGMQQLTLIDTQARVMGVYHVELASGKVVLKSVRNVHWDLQMDEFNGQRPTPREIQSLLQQRP